VMRILGGLALLLLVSQVAAQQAVFVPTDDGGKIAALVYGAGERGVVLAHGGRLRKESWNEQAQILAKAGFLVLAFDFRGFGDSVGPGQADFDSAPYSKDVMAAVRYLRTAGASRVSVVGGSFGAAAAGDASIENPVGSIDRIVFLGAAPNRPAGGLRSRCLFIVARGDRNADGPRLPRILAQFELAPEPKKLVLLEGTAHAQFLFQTEQKDRVMAEILEFLQSP